MCFTVTVPKHIRVLYACFFKASPSVVPHHGSHLDHDRNVDCLGTVPESEAASRRDVGAEQRLVLSHHDESQISARTRVSPLCRVYFAPVSRPVGNPDSRPQLQCAFSGRELDRRSEPSKQRLDVDIPRGVCVCWGLCLLLCQILTRQRRVELCVASDVICAVSDAVCSLADSASGHQFCVLCCFSVGRRFVLVAFPWPFSLWFQLAADWLGEREYASVTVLSNRLDHENRGESELLSRDDLDLQHFYLRQSWTRKWNQRRDRRLSQSRPLVDPESSCDLRLFQFQRAKSKQLARVWCDQRHCNRVRSCFRLLLVWSHRRHVVADLCVDVHDGAEDEMRDASVSRYPIANYDSVDKTYAPAVDSELRSDLVQSADENQCDVRQFHCGFEGRRRVRQLCFDW